MPRRTKASKKMFPNIAVECYNAPDAMPHRKLGGCSCELPVDFEPPIAKAAESRKGWLSTAAAAGSFGTIAHCIGWTRRCMLRVKG